MELEEPQVHHNSRTTTKAPSNIPRNAAVPSRPVDPSPDVSSGTALMAKAMAHAPESVLKYGSRAKRGVKRSGWGKQGKRLGMTRRI